MRNGKGPDRNAIRPRFSRRSLRGRGDHKGDRDQDDHGDHPQDKLAEEPLRHGRTPPVTWAKGLLAAYSLPRTGAYGRLPFGPWDDRGHPPRSAPRGGRRTLPDMAKFTRLFPRPPAVR
ncbi:hypothetical protein TBS_33120 [Thermobispora bispora]